jgi:2,3-bisphosphoglycerate-dependent phosphoglycerate mutase
MYRLVLVRHGESLWNQENRFTGWYDVDLSDKGRVEALTAGKNLMIQGFQFDVVYTSVLKRAIHTMDAVLKELDLVWLPIYKEWRLNERHYGALQGLNKAETAAKHGEEQVKIWRRSYDIPPPSMPTTDPKHPSHERRYAALTPSQLPAGESLKNTVERFLPLWNEKILPDLKKGLRPLIVAHGNSLRALIQHLENMSSAEILELNVPTGVPLVYELDANFKVLKKEYIGNPDQIAAAMAAVANQGKKY